MAQKSPPFLLISFCQEVLEDFLHFIVEQRFVNLTHVFLILTSERGASCSNPPRCKGVLTFTTNCDFSPVLLYSHPFFKAHNLKGMFKVDLFYVMGGAFSPISTFTVRIKATYSTSFKLSGLEHFILSHFLCRLIPLAVCVKY